MLPRNCIASTQQTLAVWICHGSPTFEKLVTLDSNSGREVFFLKLVSWRSFQYRNSVASVINESGAVDGTRIDKRNWNTLKTPVTISHCSRIIHNLTEYWTRSWSWSLAQTIYMELKGGRGGKCVKSWPVSRTLYTAPYVCSVTRLFTRGWTRINNYKSSNNLPFKTKLGDWYLARCGDNWVTGKGKNQREKYPVIDLEGP
jgi:hypothetical protein